MKKKHIAVVGGGITGCVTALLAAKKGLDVSLYEISDSLGGVLKDLKAKDERFINGCQYFEPAKWFNELQTHKEYEEIFHKLTLSHGSYTKFNNKSHAEKNYPEATFVDSFKNFKLNFKNQNNLADRYECYPKKISQYLKKWVKRFQINLEDLKWNAASKGLLTSRIYLKKHLPEIIVYKKKDSLADELYGIPRTELNLKEVKAFLPRVGYDEFFSDIHKKLLNSGVKVFTKTPIRPNYSKNNFSLISGNKKIDCDYIVWSCNPTGLIKCYDNTKLQSKNIKVRVYCFNLNEKLNNHFYTHVYTKNSSIFRIFLYRLSGKSKITLECFDEEENIKNITKNISKILKDFKINTKLSKKNLKLVNRQRRYFLVSLSDEKTLKTFFKKTKNSNLICGAWNIYGREKKIDYLESQINSLIA